MPVLRTPTKNNPSNLGSLANRALSQVRVSSVMFVASSTWMFGIIPYCFREMVHRLPNVLLYVDDFLPLRQDVFGHGCEKRLPVLCPGRIPAGCKREPFGSPREREDAGEPAFCAKRCSAHGDYASAGIEVYRERSVSRCMLAPRRVDQHLLRQSRVLRGTGPRFATA
jgi:hypothetical protein